MYEQVFSSLKTFEVEVKTNYLLHVVFVVSPEDVLWSTFLLSGEGIGSDLRCILDKIAPASGTDHS